MNHIIIIGRVTKDLELRTTQSGMSVCKFTIAVDKQLSKDKKAEMQQKGHPTVDFPQVMTWGRQAEVAAQYLAKGRKVAIEGSLQTGSYKDKDGKMIYTCDILASHIEFLEKAESKPQVHDETSGFDNDFSGTSFEDDGCPF